MDAAQLKQLVAQTALAHVPAGAILGVGTGSTVDCFIDALAESGIALASTVSSSERSTARLRARGYAVLRPVPSSACRSISTAPTRSTTTAT